MTHQFLGNYLYTMIRWIGFSDCI